MGYNEADAVRLARLKGKNWRLIEFFVLNFVCFIEKWNRQFLCIIQK
jgi:hypothetical protein